MEREFIKSEFFLESTRTYLDKIFNINYELIMTENFDEYVLKSLFIQKLPTLRNILLSNRIPKMETLLIPFTKQKYEVALEGFKTILNESSKVDSEESIVVSSAKVKFVKFKILSEMQFAMFDCLKLNEDKKQRKNIQNKITREIESLVFHIKIANDSEHLNDKIVEDFFKNFICILPDVYLIEDILVDIFVNLEFDSEWIQIFKINCKKNNTAVNSINLNISKEKIDNSDPSSVKKEVEIVPRKKRNFVQMQQETIVKNSKDSLDNHPLHSIKPKKLKTIDNYFGKELGFRNVKEKIEGTSSTNSIQRNSNSKKEIAESIKAKTNYDSSSTIFNKSSLINSKPITPSSIMTELNLSYNMNIISNNFITRESLYQNMNNVTLTADEYNYNNESQGDIELNEANTKDIEKFSDVIQKENESMSELNLNDNNNSNIINGPVQMNRFDSRTSLSLNMNNGINGMREKLNEKNRTNFSELNLKGGDTDPNNIVNSNNKSTNFSNLSLINSAYRMNNYETSSFNLNDNSQLTQIRSNSNNIVYRGINSRLAGNIQHIAKTKKTKKTNSVRKKNSNERIIEKFFDRIQNKIKEDAFDKKKDIKKSKEGINSNINRHINSNSQTNLKKKNSETESISTNNPLKKIINKQFYAKEKDLKSPSPIQVTCPKYSKRALNLESASGNENIEINHNSNTSTISHLELTNVGMMTNSNTNSNISSLEGKFDVLKTIKYNKSNTSSNAKKSPDLSTGLTFSSVGDNNNLIILNKIKDKAINKIRNNNNNSDDEILVYATPTKTNENIKFGKKSPNSVISSKVNLMNLFNQFKQQKK